HGGVSGAGGRTGGWGCWCAGSDRRAGAGGHRGVGRARGGAARRGRDRNGGDRRGRDDNSCGGRTPASVAALVVGCRSTGTHRPSPAVGGRVDRSVAWSGRSVATRRLLRSADT